MGVVIGIDVGGSTTKIIGVENKSIQSPMFVKATDPVTSLFGAFGKYIYDNGITLPEIEMVMLTGVGSAFIDQPLYGLPTAKTDEFLANGLGAKYAASLENLIVVSMGTGTSFVKVEGPHIQHIGGIGIGGGTLLGLSRLLLKTQDIHLIPDEYRPPDTGHLQQAPARPAAGRHRLQLRKGGRQRLSRRHCFRDYPHGLAIDRPGCHPVGSQQPDPRFRPDRQPDATAPVQGNFP